MEDLKAALLILLILLQLLKQEMQLILVTYQSRENQEQNVHQQFVDFVSMEEVNQQIMP